MSEHRTPGPAPVLESAERVTVTLEGPMLDRIRERAEKQRITQAEVIRRLLRKAMR